MAITRPGLEPATRTNAETQISRDVVLQVVLFQLEKLNPADREWVLKSVLSSEQGKGSPP